MKKTLHCLLAVCLVFVLTASQAPGRVFADADTGTIRIVHTNDTHGRYAAGEDTVGYAKLQTIVNGDGARADLVLDAGDAFHGLPFATVEQGAAVAELFQSIGYTAMTPGNHDFNYGTDRLLELGTDSGVPILSCNVLREDTQQPVFTPSVGLTVQGFRVGLIGVTSPDICGDTAPGNVEGLVFADPAACVQREIDRLQGEGCTIVIVLAHMGDSAALSWTSERLVSETAGIDLVIDGHTHSEENRLVSWKDGQGQALCVQAGAFFSGVGVVTLEVDRTTGRPVNLGTACEALVTAAQAQEIGEDPGIAAQIQSIEQRQSAILGGVIAQSPEEAPYSWEEVRCAQTAIGTVIADAYLAGTGADVACENAGGIRAGLPKGEITAGDVIAIAPFGNTVVTKEVTGQTILGMLEASLSLGLRSQAAWDAGSEGAWPEESGSFLQWSGLTVTWDPAAPEGERVVEVKLGRRALDPEKTYVLATNSFVAACADYPALAASPEKNQYGACDELLARYLSGGGEEAPDWTASLSRTVFTAAQGEAGSSAAPSSAAPSSAPPASSEAAVSSQALQQAGTEASALWAVGAAVVVLAGAGVFVVVSRRRRE